MQKIFGVLLLVVGLGIVLFLSRGGYLSDPGVMKIFPTLPSSTPAESGSEASSSTEGEVAQVPPQETTSGGYNTYPSTPPTTGGGVTPPQTTPTESEINPFDIPEGFTAKDLSPSFHKVRLSSVWPADIGNLSQVSIYTSFEGTSSIDVSGWLLQANKGSSYVPKAVNFYSASGLSPETDIVLRNGDALNMYFGGSSPIGVNLRLNLCTGYLANHNIFNPDLPRSCPGPELTQTQLQSMSGACQDYVQSLWGCTEPDTSELQIPYSDYSCQNYINTLNYAGCVSNYSSRADFLSNEWRAWVGGYFLDTRHDRVLLLDRRGLLVDLITY